MGKDVTKILTLTKTTPSGQMYIGTYCFKVRRPLVVCFTEEDFKKHIEGQKKMIEVYFEVEDFKGEEKLKPGQSIDLEGPEPVIEDNDDDDDKKNSKQELEEILEDGKPEVLAAFIKSNGVDSVPNNTLKAVLSSLDKELLKGNKSYSNTELNKMLVKYIEDNKG